LPINARNCYKAQVSGQRACIARLSEPWLMSQSLAPLRTLFVSDLHLGALGCRADLLLEFLVNHTAETYVLVGDVFDLWHPIFAQWGPPQQAVIDHLRARQSQGARLIYVRGNHDPAIVPDARALPVTPQDHLVHAMADGRRFLVLHGDEVDVRMFRTHLMTRIGSHLDFVLRSIDRALVRRLWQVAAHRRSVIETLLAMVARAYALRRSHEHKLVARAQAQGLDGVICGHFHVPGLHDRLGLTYANCGDWVDSFTALAENRHGRLVLLGGRRAHVPGQSPAPQLAAVR
jgi:UDP-2,3-diacylglucosamine pyrophosphatase LpxH